MWRVVTDAQKRAQVVTWAIYFGETEREFRAFSRTPKASDFTRRELDFWGVTEVPGLVRDLG